MRVTIEASKGTAKNSKRVAIMAHDVKGVTVDASKGTRSTLAFGTVETDVHDERTGERSGTLTVADSRRSMPLDDASLLLDAERFTLRAVVTGSKGSKRTVALPVRFAARNGRPFAEGTVAVDHGGKRWNLTIAVRAASKRTGDEVALTIRATEAASNTAVKAPERVALADLFA